MLKLTTRPVLSTGVTFVRKRISPAHDRTRTIHWNTALGVAIKGATMGVSLLLVPLTIVYLSTAVYGTWITLSSLVTMLTFLDLGIGNGLRNKLAEAVALQDLVTARALVSTAYCITGLLQVTYMGLFFLLFVYVPWQPLLNTTVDAGQLERVALLMAGKVVLDLLSFVLLAVQETARVSLLNLFANLVLLVATYLLTRVSRGNLLYLGVATALSPIGVWLLGSVSLYRGRLRPYRPAIRLIDRRQVGRIGSLGYQFFLIQLAYIVIFYTDTFIINQLAGPTEVTTYSVAFRYFSSATTLFILVITPYWSAITNAFAQQDTPWMRQTYRRLLTCWLYLAGLLGVMLVGAQPVYRCWLRDRVEVPFLTNACLALFVLVTCWNMISATILNGLGKVKLQMYYAVLGAVMNVPLAILLGKYLHLGSAGVVLASTLSLGWGAILGPIQTHKLLRGTATGLWNR